ncbi:hypothetical protein DEH84_06985 [Aquabacterium olei]|uniref:Uncharacterized protein n=1 Tax=Aquabacterium olei TaxID=1296669 RepID=A0A2U8FQ65_9BURK|nr:hypothetical protein [Aquabacterium olei]AWI53201.1 hypothetical protein DEH84_06985 [Aquabacterium olei]
MPSVFITQTNRYSLAVGTTQNVTDAQAKQLYDDGAAIASELAILPTDTTPSWWRTFINSVQSWVTGAFVSIAGAQTITGAKTFNQSLSANGGLNVSGATASSEQRTYSTARVVDVTAGNAAITITGGKLSTLITSPAAAITVTMATGNADGERRRIVFGAACTVTWAASTGSVSPLAKTSFAAGESIELVWNNAAGQPANSTATTWYPF